MTKSGAAGLLQRESSTKDSNGAQISASKGVELAYRSNQNGVQRVTLSTLGVRSMLAEGLRLTGNIESEGSLAIKGSVTGDVLVTGDDGLAVVFPGARVRGKVRARFVWVMGDVEGRIECQRLLLLPGGRFVGESVCESLEVKHGSEYLPTLALKESFAAV